MWKCICVSLLLFNILRMTLILLTAYIALYAVEHDGVIVPVEFPSGDTSGFYESGSSEYDSGLDTIATDRNATTTTNIGSDEPSNGLHLDPGIEDREEFDTYENSSMNLKIPWQRSPDITDSLFLTVTILEIKTMLIITCSVMGPLTKKIPFRKWLSSMAWFRIAWKRLLFVVVSIVYTHVYLKYRKKRYEDTYGNPKYEDSVLHKVIMWVTVVEYFTLGLAEISAKLFTAERIKRELIETKKKVGNIWGNIAIMVYLTGVLASAARNLVVCLYFAFMAVFIVQIEQDEISDRSDVSVFTVVVVLQTVIVLIRGKYGNFFLYLCLGFFLHEGEKFTKLLKDEDSEKMKMESV